MSGASKGTCSGEATSVSLVEGSVVGEGRSLRLVASSASLWWRSSSRTGGVSCWTSTRLVEADPTTSPPIFRRLRRAGLLPPSSNETGLEGNLGKVGGGSSPTGRSRPNKEMILCKIELGVSLSYTCHIWFSAYQSEPPSSKQGIGGTDDQELQTISWNVLLRIFPVHGE